MATLSCAISGSAIAGANNTRSITISDADLQTVLNWLQATQLQLIADHFNGGVTQGFTPTNAQLEWGWMQCSIVNGTKSAVQQWQTTVTPGTGVTIT